MQSDPESRRAPSDLIPQSARPVQAPSDALPVPRQLQLFASALLRVQMVMIYNIFLLILQASIDGSACSFDQSIQMLDQRRLSGTCMSDDPHKFSMWNLQANVF